MFFMGKIIQETQRFVFNRLCRLPLIFSFINLDIIQRFNKNF